MALDRWLHTTWLYLAGLILGIIAGFVELIRACVGIVGCNDIQSLTSRARQVMDFAESRLSADADEHFRPRTQTAKPSTPELSTASRASCWCWR